jgi:two-component system LytT family response regulator
MELKVLIIDDDEGMRTILGKIVNKIEGFTLAGEAPDGETGLGLARNLLPNVVFLDVEMPGMDGVECAKRILDIAPKTFIIFATAHEEYMPEAFELYASDYLLKPFKIERISNTLGRIRGIIEGQSSLPVKLPQHISGSLSKLVIKNKEGVLFIDCKDIIFIERENNSTIIHTASERITTSESLSEIEERLDKSAFLRSHKSYIINLSMITKVSPYGRWTYIVKLRGTSKDALVTHDRFEYLEKLFTE